MKVQQPDQKCHKRIGDRYKSLNSLLSSNIIIASRFKPAYATLALIIPTNNLITYIIKYNSTKPRFILTTSLTMTQSHQNTLESEPQPPAKLAIPSSDPDHEESDELVTQKFSNNLLENLTTIMDSQRQDSVVSFEMNILEEHLHCTLIEIQRMTNLLVQTISFDLLLQTSTPQPYHERPSLHHYLNQGLSLLRTQDLPVLMELLKRFPNSHKFLQQVFEATSELLVHQLIFITFQSLRLLCPFSELNYSICELRQLSCNHSIIRMICDHPQLQKLHFQSIFGQESSYRSDIRSKIIDFLQFFILTCMLVRENYFINPYFQRIAPSLKKERKRKNRIRFRMRTKIGRKITKFSNK